MRNLTLALLMTSAGLLAQQVDPELAVNNFFRVRSNSKHPTTGNYYPYSPTVPPAYLSSPGVTAGTRGWTYTPKLRNNVIRLLSGKKASELNTPAGKEKLAVEIRSLMNEVLEPGAKEGPVKEVLFTNFIIQ